jgi:hypothetical protein
MKNEKRSDGRMEQRCRDQLLALARGYAEAKGIALSTVARKFHGADFFLEEFERGNCTVTLRKYDEMIDALKANWPKGTKLPRKNYVKSSRSVR